MERLYTRIVLYDRDSMNKEADSKEFFFKLLQAGLWEKAKFSEFNCLVNTVVDWAEVYRLSEEQSVVGVVLAGIERLKNNINSISIPLELLLQWIGEVQLLEQQNKAMNQFIAMLVEKMRNAEDIYTLLVKGQGLAQCYEKPLWRACGDIDFLLSDTNYKMAKAFLLPLSSSHNPEGKYSKHFVMNIESWVVELHGTLRTGLSGRIDKQVNAVQKDIFYGGNVRSWNNGKTQIFLPSPTEDVFLVFTHFIKHFYKEGMSLRQICDWCRLLWTYRESLNYGNLELWINKAGLMKEWKTFYNLASRYLGMPYSDSRLMAHDSRFDKKAERLMAFILGGYSGNKIKDTLQIAKIFPWKALRYAPSIFLNVNWLKLKERMFIRQR